MIMKILKHIGRTVAATLVFTFGLYYCAMAQYDYTVEFIGNPEFSDTLPNNRVAFRYNLLDQSGKRLPPSYTKFKNINLADRIVSDLKRQQTKVIYVENSFQILKGEQSEGKTQAITSGSLSSDQITISVLVDKSGSMTQAKIDKVNEVIKDLLDKMPDGSVYLSRFHNDISTSLPISKSNFESNKIKVPVNPAESHTALYNAIYTKLLEFDSAAVIPNSDRKQNNYEPIYFRMESIYKRKTPQNYLIVLTDGKDESEKIPKYRNNDFFSVDSSMLFRVLERMCKQEKKVELWMIGIKDLDNDQFYDEPFMKSACKAAGKPDNYRRGGKDKLPGIFVDVIEKLHPDYYLQVKYPNSTRFSGFSRELEFRITLPDDKEARGIKKYSKGSKTAPYIINPPSIYEVLIKGLIIGILFLIIIVVLIQVIVPLTKSSLFHTKNVKKYKPDADTETLSCSWCKQEIKSGEKAVFACAHISHWSCWKENNHQCPNYPEMCSQGKQDYFDINDPFSREDTDSVVKQNKKRFMRWIVSGIVAGLITWLLYQILLPKGIFDGLFTFLLPEDDANLHNYIEKYSPLLLLGSLLGFFLSGFFLYIEEYLKIDFKIGLRLFLRAIIGSISGFLSFLAGSYILILLGVFQTSLIDILPWVIFGPVLGFYLSIKTSLSAVHGLIGGLFSIVFSFIFLYLFNSFNEEYMIVLSMVVYGGGLGAAISTIRQMAEKYFLILSNAPIKNKDFPLHKWISKRGDYGVFSIGKGKDCMIRLDWEKGDTISEDVHAVIYLEKSKKEYPVISIRDAEHKTYLNEHVLMKPEKEYTLHHGDTFKLGETLFKYEEKQD